MQLTPSQAKALSTERHLAILANAGSGKTRVLVERYINLFERYVGLATKNVVAITFTENAASELRSRILKEVTERLKDTPDREVRMRLRHLRDSLPNAFIGTIHGFASRILRAYPVEANVDAAFGILSGADQRLMIEDAIGTVFYSTLEEAYEKENSEVLTLFRTLGRHAITELVRALLSNRARTDRIQRDLLSKSDTEIIQSWRYEIERSLQFISTSWVRSLLFEIKSNLKTGIKGQEVLPLFEEYVSADSFLDRARTFYALCDKLITEKGTLHSQRVNLDELSDDLKPAISVFIKQFNTLCPLLENIPASEEEFLHYHQQYLNFLRSVFSLYHEVLNEYETTKAEFGLLDFDDLIFKLRKLLEQSEVRDELTREFRFIMIDEYQDTDESQFELAKLLTKNFAIENNLAVVGDPKQAIYTFRNADAGVFRQTMDAIVSQSLTETALKESITLELSEENERGPIRLNETFRMTATPLAAINRLFRTVMQQAETTFGIEPIDYSDLVHGRPARLNGRIEWICPDAPKRTRNTNVDEDGESSLEEDTSESALIARKIKSIIQDTTYEVEDKEGLRRARLNDIAVLLRSRTNLWMLERALRRENIPYIVSKGAGFYEQQEIVDITSYLNFLISPTDDIALAAILRSPFFAVSDVQLFQIASYKAGRRHSLEDPWSLWKQFRDYVFQNDVPHLQRVAKQLDENLALTGRTSTSFLIEKIYAETGIFATLKAGPQAAQKAANLDKFLSQARASDAGGFAGIFDFVERIKYLVETEEQESQAEAVLANDTLGAVNIMTVHAAKGLEFPIVILPYLQKKFKVDHQRILDKELGLQITFPEREQKPLIAELIRLRAKERTIAEEQRVFYVAATRARDHLIFSCALSETPSTDSWLNWAAEAFGLSATQESINITETISRYNNETRLTHTEQVSFSIPLIRKESDIIVNEAAVKQEAAAESLPNHFFSIEPPGSDDKFSATQLLRFKDCPTEHYLTYVLRLPKMESDDDTDDTKNADHLLGLSDRPKAITTADQLGSIVHALFDRIQYVAPNGALDDAKLETEFQTILASQEIRSSAEIKSLRTKVRKHLSTFLASNISKEALTATDARSEFQLQTLLPSGDSLFGIIDRLYKDKTDTWVILDYKTESTSNKERLASKIERYKFQLGFYAYLVHLLDSHAGKIRTILFFTDSGESKEFIFGPTDFNALEGDYHSMIEQIHVNQNIADLRLLTRNESRCSECGYFNSERKSCIVLTAS